MRSWVIFGCVTKAKSILPRPVLCGNTLQLAVDNRATRNIAILPLTTMGVQQPDR